MLFDGCRHEELTTSIWDDGLVRTEISKIIEDIQKSLLPNSCWPTHPLDAVSYPRSGPKWSAYAGASGTIHALQILGRYGYKVDDFSELLENIYQSFLKEPDVMVEPGLQIGELGILIPGILAQPENRELAQRIIRCMEATIDPPMYEITSGQSGMMHAALALYRKTGQLCWRELYLKGAKALMDNWIQDAKSGEWLWQSQVFGHKRQYYGACHGVAGNANILLQGKDLLPHSWTQTIIQRAVSTLRASVKSNANLVNWPCYAKQEKGKFIVQWCHGAAGIVTAMARIERANSADSNQIDELLLKTGELVWQAGPLKKGSGICHGTSGNGYALLYLYQRWKDLIWLDRARKFSMHAIEQCRRDRLRYGQGRFTLWTGDAGLAIYLHHCLYPEGAAIPGLDLF